MRVEYDEDSMVGEAEIPRCPEMPSIPLEVYENDASDTGIYSVVDLIGDSDMTVTLLQKNKVQGKPTQATGEKSELDVKVEKIIVLKVAVDAHKSTAKDYETTRKELAKIADDVGAANEQVVFNVETGSVAFSPKSFQRKVTDMKKVFEMLTAINPELVYLLASFSMEDLEKYLGAAALEGVTSNELTGARKISVVPKEKTVTQDVA